MRGRIPVSGILMASAVGGFWAKLSVADPGSNFGGPAGSQQSEFLSKLLESFQSSKGLSGMQEMLKNFGANAGFANGSGDTPFGDVFEGVENLDDILKDFGKKDGTSKLSLSSAMQTLIEKFATDSGEDGGLLHQFRELQNMNDGPMDFDKVASMYKGISAALKERGTDINQLMTDMLNGPMLDVAKISPPEELRELYRKSIPQPIEDELGSDIMRPPAVSLSTIRSSIGTLSERLPPPVSGAKCHGLVLSGGVARAPLQAGAILGLAEQYKARQKQLRWDVVAGVNNSAISAATSLAFLPGENGEINWARYLWDTWSRVSLEQFFRCQDGIKGLLNLPRIFQWLLDAQDAVGKYGVHPGRLGVSHDCDTTAAQETLTELLQQLPLPRAAAAAELRRAVVTAAIVGGGKEVWELSSVGSAETCLAPAKSLASVFPSESVCRREEERGYSDLMSSIPQTELDLTVAALMASSATPGVYPLVHSWGAEGPLGPPGTPRSDAGKGPYRPKVTYADGRLVANISAGEAIRACQRQIRAQNATNQEGTDRETAAALVEKGRGIVLDIVGVAPIDQAELEEQLSNVADKLNVTPRPKNATGARRPSNELAPMRLIARIKKRYPLITIRHVLFPENTFPLMTDYGDFRSSEALLHHGRLIGWRATTLEDVE